jgi:hypothetical protein
VSIPSEAFISHGTFKKLVLGRIGGQQGAASALRLDERSGQTATQNVLTCHYQGGSHAEWPKYKHE